MRENNQIIDEIVESSCLKLFEDYQLPLVPCDAATLAAHKNDLLLCGILGFSGEQMRGTLLLATTAEPLGKTSPSGDGQMREWIAELSNQLLGRVKNRVREHGATIYISTPVVLRGQHLAPMPRTELLPQAFTCEGGYVCVWVEVEYVDGFVLSAEAVVDDTAVSEGEAMLF